MRPAHRYGPDVTIWTAVAAASFVIGSSCFPEKVKSEPTPTINVQTKPPVIVLVPQDGRKPILPPAATLPEADLESLIRDLKKHGITDAEAARMRRDFR